MPTRRVTPEILAEFGLRFQTDSGLPRATEVCIDVAQHGVPGMPLGYQSWEQLADRVREVFPTTYLTNGYYQDAIDAINSLSGQTSSDMATKPKRTMLALLNHLGKNHKTISTTAYSWNWLNDRIQKLMDDWYKSSGIPRARRWQELWEEGNSDGFYKRTLAICNAYLKKHYPECPEIIQHSFFYYTLGFKDSLVEVHHVRYHNNPEEYTEEIQYQAKNIATTNEANGYIKKVDGKYYTTDNWFNVRKFNKNGKAELVEIFWPKDKHNFGMCQFCREQITKDSLVPILELETTACPPCASKPRVNKKHTMSSIYGDYHSHANWKFFIRRTVGEWDSLPMGIEIEMLLRSPDTIVSDEERISPTGVAWELYNKQIEINPNWNEFYCERDGSLHQSYGIELISNPMTLGFAQQYWEKMLPIVRQYCVGWNTNKHGDKAHSYGIHLTTNKKYWTDLQLARLIKFIDNPENALFMYCMAQRNYNYGTKKVPIGGGVYKTLSGAVKIVDKKIVTSRDRYSSVNIKSKNLVELRIFASTLQQDSFLKNYEFLDSFWNWVKVTPFNIDYKNYLAWVSLQPLTYKRYPHLLRHLLKDNFFFKVEGGKAVKQENIFKKFIKTLPVGQQSLDLEVTGEIVETTIQDKEDIECV